MNMQDKTIRIGGGSAFWGDSSSSLPSLIQRGNLDYLMLEYLAEITMALLARARTKSPDAGFVPDFISAMATHLPAIRAQGIKVVTNAGGMNPAACAAALREVAEEQGIALNIAIVEGDDVIAMAEDFRGRDIGDWRTGAPLPPADTLLSMNAYLGAVPVERALAAGADVVITGRNVDSALVLGPLMHEFGWTAADYDLLAAGSICGHLIECGPQATGGNFTDWETVPGWENIGYPIAECKADGTFDVTKAEGTGGLVSTQTVGEQLLYEIDDPASYMLPDVTVDLRQITLEQTDDNRVSVKGARGRPPSESYKATVTANNGYRSTAMFMVGGIDAVAKAQRTADAILAKTSALIQGAGFVDFTETSVETIGGEATYGPHGRVPRAREVMVKIAVKHPEKRALAMFTREIAPASIGMAPGLTGFAGGRPGISPVITGSSALVPKSVVPVRVTLDGKEIFNQCATATNGHEQPALLPAVVAAPCAAPGVTVPLIALAHARSGDKGNDAQIALLARKPEYLAHIARAVTADVVADHFGHVLKGGVTRYDVPGVHAFIFQLRDALGGGGMASLRIDPQGKAFAQMLLDLDVEVPADLLDRGDDGS